MWGLRRARRGWLAGPGLVGGFGRVASRGSPSKLMDFVRRTEGRLAAPGVGLAKCGNSASVSTIPLPLPLQEGE